MAARLVSLYFHPLVTNSIIVTGIKFSLPDFISTQKLPSLFFISTVFTRRNAVCIDFQLPTLLRSHISGAYVEAAGL